MNKPQNIIVHHTAVSYEKNPNQFDATNNYHRDTKGFPKGSLGFYVGYHYMIEKNGEVKQSRADNDVGAHTSQQSMNYLSLGICLTGDFDKEEPTLEQINSLKKLIESKQKQYNIPAKNVVPHRHYAPKTCWGSKLPDDILTYLSQKTMTDTPVTERELTQEEKDDVELVKSMGVSNGSNPFKAITRLETMMMFARFFRYMINKFHK